ncbi:MAG: hypothetical protein AVDCRST_MAG77-3488 [uncultured Chloroflexi bacterium]|uniref:DUF4178 domain-containing protein n=1 Tax=uncultured Chloroflexota bacterium TaxID=166587 RepID=A0A6J4JCE6_9CHLR|nr:MAG: hypothetical protein AVDCRST_MAG77-3488 [uncultured Chloroflexota bacterium]
MNRPSRSGGARTADVAATSTGGALGTGLLILGIVLAALIGLWLVVNAVGGDLRAGGFMLGLIFLAVFSLPLIGAGWFLRQRGRVEVAETETFSERRAVLDADAAMRRALVRDTERLLADLGSSLPALPPAAADDARRAVRVLRDVREDLSRPGYNATTWLDSAAGLGPEQLANVRRYDDLVSAQVRQLRESAEHLKRDPQAATALAEGADQLAERVREREALMGRGREAAALRPQELLAAGASPRQRIADPIDLNLEDAVSYLGNDYLVRAIVEYFGGGRRWRAYQLHDGKRERWLEVGPGGDLLMLDPAEAPAGAGDTVTYEGQTLPLVDRGTATVGIRSAAGSQDSVLVEYRRYRAGITTLVSERWPDGPRASAGSPLAREDLDLWTKPPAAEQPGT